MSGKSNNAFSGSLIILVHLLAVWEYSRIDLYYLEYSYIINQVLNINI